MQRRHGAQRPSVTCQGDLVNVVSVTRSGVPNRNIQRRCGWQAPGTAPGRGRSSGKACTACELPLSLLGKIIINCHVTHSMFRRPLDCSWGPGPFTPRDSDSPLRLVTESNRPSAWLNGQGPGSQVRHTWLGPRPQHLVPGEDMGRPVTSLTFLPPSVTQRMGGLPRHED